MMTRIRTIGISIGFRIENHRRRENDLLEVFGTGCNSVSRGETLATLRLLSLRYDDI